MFEVSGLEAGYSHNQMVLKGLDFTVAPGEIVAILGANGAGKTTTLRALTGLLPSRRGTIVYEGHNIAKVRSHKIVSMGIAMVPEGRQVFARLTVLENLRLGAYSVKSAGQREEDVARVFQIFPRLDDRKTQPAGSLSGGEQQMLVLGRGLMSRPRLLLLDEPSMGLSPVLLSAVYDTIVEINRQGTAVLLVEQNARMALRISDRAYVMETGRFVLQGMAAEVASDDGVRRAYLGESAGPGHAHESVPVF